MGIRALKEVVIAVGTDAGILILSLSKVIRKANSWLARMAISIPTNRPWEPNAAPGRPLAVPVLSSTTTETICGQMVR